MNVRPLILLLVLMPGLAAARNAPDAGVPDRDPGPVGIAKAMIGTTSGGASNPVTDTPPGATSPTIENSSDPQLRNGGSGPSSIPNPAIDMDAYLRVSMAAAAHRQSHRVSEQEFLRMSSEPGTVVLDARSAEKYRLLHVKGAVNLSFPDLTVDSLNQTIHDKSTRILIYCNNNFSGAEKPFPAKLPSASLNLSTYIALYNYGYRNVYELGPLIDLKASKLDFEGTE
jgi:hypothetical protein